MTLPVQSPTLPSPPLEYDQQFMDRLLLELRTFFLLLNTTGELRGSTLHLSGVPSSGVGLAVGSLYERDGVLMIVREKDIFFETPSAAVGSIGAVTTTP